MTENTTPQPWKQQPDEPSDWYDRFHVYLMLGPSRTLTAAFRAWAKSRGTPSGALIERARKWRWKERALDYDQAGREEQATFAQTRLNFARERRLHHAQTHFGDVSAAISNANLADLSQEEARAMFPHLRPFFNSLVEHERRELQSDLGAPPDESKGITLVPPYAQARRILSTYPSEKDDANHSQEENDSLSGENDADSS